MMTSDSSSSAHEFDDLPEPARSQAVAFLDELLESGQERGQAREKARELAEKWAKERVPGQG